jgi:hypothetical protein
MYVLISAKNGWATFLAIFSQIHLVTLPPSQEIRLCWQQKKSLGRLNLIFATSNKEMNN